jgi:hypothetical protein
VENTPAATAYFSLADEGTPQERFVPGLPPSSGPTATANADEPSDDDETAGATGGMPLPSFAEARDALAALERARRQALPPTPASTEAPEHEALEGMD